MNPSDQKSAYEQVVEENKELRAQIERIKAELEQLRRMILGKKLERLESQPSPGQLALELDQEKVQFSPEEQPVPENTPDPNEQKQHPGSNTLPRHLRRVRFVSEPDMDTSGMVFIGEEVTEVLSKQASAFVVIQIVRKKYANPDGSGVVIGKMPSRALENSIAHESLLAYILVRKFVDHQPLTQLTQIGEGLHIPASTISDWTHACCQLLLPLYQALKEELFYNQYLQVSGLPIKVVDKDGKGGAHKGWQWLYISGDQKLAYFDYQKGKNQDGPKKMLENFNGYLQTDGLSVYEAFEKNPGITLLACMAQVRRKFEEAMDHDPARAGYFLALVQQLYHLEAKLTEEGADWERCREIRQVLVVPILNDLGQWLKMQYSQVLPTSAIGKAIAYSLKRWKLICRYPEHGGFRLDIDLIESQIRPMALGQKSYLFADSNQAAKNAAILYSFFGSCKLNGLDPYRWLYAILGMVRDYPIDKISDLLPCYASFENPEEQ